MPRGFGAGAWETVLIGAAFMQAARGSDAGFIARGREKLTSLQRRVSSWRFLLETAPSLRRQRGLLRMQLLSTGSAVNAACGLLACYAQREGIEPCPPLRT